MNREGKNLKVIITGATGMVGAGVLQVCLQHPNIAEILVIGRKPTGIQHPKLKEIIHQNFYDVSPIEQSLRGYEACFFCLGISSVGVDKNEYYKVAYTLTMHVAGAISRASPNSVFCYISGAGTGENSRQNWARVKAKTERDLRQLPFTEAYGLRPGFIKPVQAQNHVNPWYKYIKWMFPIGRKLYAKGFCTMEELASCMIHLAQRGYPKNILSGDDIIREAK